VKRISKILLWTGLLVIAVFGAEDWLWNRYLAKAFKMAEAGQYRKTGPRAEAEARAQADAGFAWWLASQFGSLDVPANREKAFLSFLDSKRIRLFSLEARLSSTQQSRHDSETAARWIAKYRATMTAQERADLQARLNSDSGRAMLQQANASFQSLEVSFRGNVTPAVAEVLATVADLQKGGTQ
jgi:hypothetical protein